MTTTRNLRLTSLTHSQYLRTCGYWYVITDECRAHTAFRTKAGVLQWAMERGLVVRQMLPNPGAHGDMASGEHTTQEIRENYREQMHYSPADVAEFDAMKPLIVTRTLSNGDYVEAKITQDADGMRTVHTLNPNVQTRQLRRKRLLV